MNFEYLFSLIYDHFYTPLSKGYHLIFRVLLCQFDEGFIDKMGSVTRPFLFWCGKGCSILNAPKTIGVNTFIIIDVTHWLLIWKKRDNCGILLALHYVTIENIKKNKRQRGKM